MAVRYGQLPETILESSVENWAIYKHAELARSARMGKPNDGS